MHLPPPLPQPWELVKKTATKVKLRLASADADVELRYSPAALEVSQGGAPLLSWNAGRQFIFEHTREKQVQGSAGGEGAALGVLVVWQGWQGSDQSGPACCCACRGGAAGSGWLACGGRSLRHL